uniref:RNA-guided endonuclease InsQ/TnpB family protein n=1 Tax=Okeania sp. SIO2F4 TaxID=2607790 RepID=UPI0035C8B10E
MTNRKNFFFFPLKRGGFSPQFLGKYEYPKHFLKHENNLKRKQKKLARKEKGSNLRKRYRKLVAKVSERVSNSRQDFLHKLSAKLVRENQTVVVENLHILGMVCNHKIAKSISDCRWGIFVNFLAYKLERNDIDILPGLKARGFLPSPSSSAG